jgi:hypothetical protein
MIMVCREGFAVDHRAAGALDTGAFEQCAGRAARQSPERRLRGD